MKRDAQTVAQLSAQAMWGENTTSQTLGMRIEEVGPGFAVLSMSVASTMVNGHGYCHGGYIFALADSAFAFAGNSRNQRHVAQHCHITYLAPGRLGMRLTASAQERQRGKRSGIYDVTISAEGGETIAEFRGHSRAIDGTLLTPSAGPRSWTG